MKRSINIIFFSLICFIITFTNLSADSCDKALKDANKVEAYYKIINDNNEIYFVLEAKGLTNNIYINVYNDKENEKQEFLYTKENNGKISFEYFYIYEITKFKFNIYSNTEDCKDTLLKSIDINTPKFNEYYGTKTCIDNPEFEYCIPFLNIETKKNDNTQNGIIGTDSNDYTITEDEFNSYFSSYLLKKEKLESNILYKIWHYIKIYYLYFLIPLLIVSILYLIMIIKIKKKVKK